MKCPHCLNLFFEQLNEQYVNWPDNKSILRAGAGLHWGIKTTLCPSCEEAIIFLQKKDEDMDIIEEYLIFPKGYARAPLPKEVLDKYAKDYREACVVLADSPNASAALSRRCLQNLLREVAKVRPSNLADEIQQAIDSKTLPSGLADSIDAVRQVGNFGAHPLKSTNTGEIIDVEPGEAEWNLEVLEELFDFYFVRPSRVAARQEAMNKKLADAGKEPMKTSKPDQEG